MDSTKAIVSALTLSATLLGCGATPHGSGSITTFALPHADSLPQEIVKGPDGNMWFLEHDDRIGRITTAGVITEFSVPAGSRPTDITVGPDGALWFTEFNSKLGRITTAGAASEFPVTLKTGTHLDRILSLGGALWVTPGVDDLEAPKHIARITTTGKVTEFDLHVGRGLVSEIAAGPDGGIWFTVTQDARIGRFDPATHASVLYSKGLDPDPLPIGIVAGPDRAMWFDQWDNVGRIDLQSHAIKTFTPPQSKSPTAFSEVALGADGNLWFTDFNYDRIWRVDPQGAMTAFSDGIPDQASPKGIAMGSDDALWFTLYNGNAIGRMQL